MIDAALVVLAKSLGRRGRNAKRGVIVIATLMEMQNLEMCGRNAKCVTKVIATNVTEHHDETEKIH